MIFVCDIKEKGDFCIQYQRKGWFLYAISKKRVFSVCDIKEKGDFCMWYQRKGCFLYAISKKRVFFTNIQYILTQNCKKSVCNKCTCYKYLKKAKWCSEIIKLEK